MTVTAMSVGFGNYIIRERIIAILGADSAPMRRIIQEARKQNTLIDATQGRRTKCVVFMDNNQILISGLSQDTLARRAGLQGEAVD